MRVPKSDLNRILGWVLVVTAVFCFVAIGNLPYGFYQILRWIVCGTAIGSAFSLRYHPGWMWGMFFIAMVFNPIFPIHLDKPLWRIFDGGSGIAFLSARIKLKYLLQ